MGIIKWKVKPIKKNMERCLHQLDEIDATFDSMMALCKLTLQEQPKLPQYMESYIKAAHDTISWCRNKTRQDIERVISNLPQDALERESEADNLPLL